jgi:hypothetical protein
MTSFHRQWQPRAPSDVPWDTARERRVLDVALVTKRSRARRRLALELAAALAVTFVAGRVLPHTSTEDGEARPALSVAPAAHEARPQGNESVDTGSENTAQDGVRMRPGEETPRGVETKVTPMGGFAGTGGHGGTGGAGHGGSAGTG